MKIKYYKINIFFLTGIISLFIVSPILAADKSTVGKPTRAQVQQNVGSPPASVRKQAVKFERVILKGVTLTEKSGTTLTVSKDDKKYIVTCDSKTKFRRRFWGKATLEEIKPNDILDIIGTFTDENKVTIAASMIRDTSIQKRHGVFFGTVKSLTSDDWVMETKRGDQTVTVSSTTKFVNRRLQRIVQKDIAVGHRVRVKGLWDVVNNTVTEVSQVKDFSLPALVTPTPKSIK